ncbi:uncharacterized protein Tco_1064085 [Tanacetum coccineum]
MTTVAIVDTTVPSASSLTYSLINVYQNFSFKLSVDGFMYKLWRTIFLDLCTSSKVNGHITGESKPTRPGDVNWYSMDSKIKTWFYTTCEASLLKIVIRDKCTSKDLWDNIDGFFTKNKMSRSLQLKETFTTTKKGSMTITNYCQTLKNIADALSDVDSPVSETELVM